MKQFRSLALLILSALAPLAMAQTAAVTGSHVLGIGGAPLASGSLCFASTCVAVTSGSVAAGAAIPQGTGVLSLKDGGGTTFWSLPGTIVPATGFNFDGVVVAASQTLTIAGAPFTACAPGAAAIETDVTPNVTWACAASSGGIQWVNGNSAAAAAPRASGLYSGAGMPVFLCTAPCLYTRSDASSASFANYAILANAGASSSNWVLQGNPYPVTYATSYAALGDSITYGYALGSLAQRYPQLIANRLGLTLNDVAISGDQACDQFPKQVATPGLASALDANPLYSNQIGTNDVDVKHVGSYEPLFQSCHQATMGWLATPRSLMVLPGDSGMTATGGCSITPVNFTGNGISGAVCSSSSPGSITTTLLTYGKPIYGWYLINDAVSTSSCATVTVDGVSSGTSYCTGTTPSISTQNGTTASAAFIRIIPAALGSPSSPVSHTIVYSTTVGNVGLIGWGTPSNGKAYVGHPVILSGDIPNQLIGGGISTPASVAQYNSDVKADDALFIGDGVDVRHVPNQLYMLGSAGEMSDALHPNTAGHINLAGAYLQTAQATPASSGSGSSSTVAPWLKNGFDATSNQTLPVGVEYVIVQGGTAFSLPVPTGATQDGGSENVPYVVPVVYITNQTPASITISPSPGADFFVNGALVTTQAIASYTTAGFMGYVNSVGAVHWQKVQ
jgi:lysophospholipase L1-like esterase